MGLRAACRPCSLMLLLLLMLRHSWWQPVLCLPAVTLVVGPVAGVAQPAVLLQRCGATRVPPLMSGCFCR
jgi:hypothetical protein